MSKERLDLTYRNIRIIAAFFNGQFQARGYENNSQIYTVNNGISINGVVEKMKHQIDQALDKISQPETSSAYQHQATLQKVTTHVIAISAPDSQSILNSISIGEKLYLSPEPFNPHDPCTIIVTTKHGRIGYVPNDLAKYLQGKKLVEAHIHTLQRMDDGLVGCQIVISFSEKSIQPVYSYSFQSPPVPLAVAPVFSDFDEALASTELVEYEEEDRFDDEHEERYHSYRNNGGPDGESLEDCSADLGYAEELDWEDRF